MTIYQFSDTRQSERKTKLLGGKLDESPKQQLLHLKDQTEDDLAFIEEDEHDQEDYEPEQNLLEQQLQPVDLSKDTQKKRPASNDDANDALEARQANE